MAGKLRLPQSRETALFRAVDKILRADSGLSAVGITWRSFTGDPTDKADPTSAQCPWIRLSTEATGLQFFHPSGMEGRLRIPVELMVAGTCLDDLHNLWAAVMRGLYPSDATARLAIQTRLRTLGARTGLPLFSQVAYDPTPGMEGVLQGRGMIDIEYQFSTDPTAPDC